LKKRAFSKTVMRDVGCKMMKLILSIFVVVAATGCTTVNSDSPSSLDALDAQIAIRLERIAEMDRRRTALQNHVCQLADVSVDELELALPPAYEHGHRSTAEDVTVNREALLNDLINAERRIRHEIKTFEDLIKGI
jgi:hypothetical protein